MSVLLIEEMGIHGGKGRSAISNWHTLSHEFVSSRAARHDRVLIYERLEDTKGVIKIRQSKKNG
jgi:hypothetical protein